MLKIKSIYFALLLFAFSKTDAQQNLVPNPSFELYSTCPTTTDQLSYSTGWSSYSISPDYFNTCNGTNGLGVPSNGLGYQAASFGVAYAGFQAYDINGFAREIIGSQLFQNLLIGQKYFVTIKIALAEFNSQYLPCNKIGVKFSTVPFSVSSPAPINNFAHVFTNTIVSDTASWTIVQGSFISDSSYQYVMIGNFFDDSQTDTMNVPGGIKSYYFLDDVCVSTDSLLCSNFNGISENNLPESVNVYPNPSDKIIFIECNFLDSSNLQVFNLIGEKIIEENFVNKTSLNLSNISNGTYLIRVTNAKQTFTKKILINHN